MDSLFLNRTEAGLALAKEVKVPPGEQAIVFGLARGGVVVAAPVAEALKVPLEALVLRKIGHPGHRELGIGAMTPDGRVILNDALVARFALTDALLAPVISEEQAELTRRVALYGKDSQADDVKGKWTIVVDDGLATGGTAIAAGVYLRARQAKRLILAVPVCGRSAPSKLAEVYDEVLCLHSPDEFHAVGQAYEDFKEVSDDEVRALLANSARRLEGVS